MNPWLGLASYSEESLHHHHFYGRDKSIETLVRKIKENLFVTLYGKSGIGKSSLLQAGVIPVLKKDGYYPVVIRFDLSDSETSLARIVWDTLSERLLMAGIEFKRYGEKYVPDFNDVLVLRNIFASGSFEKEGKEIIPVMILDQFEEILYRQPNKSKLLLQQLYALIDDNLDINLAFQEWEDDTNFRIVVSIREDDLFLLEDTIDTLNLEDLKENRYRLMPLSKEEAKEIIMKPSPEIFKKGEIEAVAERIIELASTGYDKQINTLILSLLCYTLYEKEYVQGGRIAIGDLQNSNENLIETYYLEAVKNIPKEEQTYLENNLVDYQGRRNSIYLSDLRKHAPNAEKYFIHGKERLLRLNQNKIELIHDMLAEAIYNIRKNKTQKEKKDRRVKQWVVVFQSILVLLLIGVSVWIIDVSFKKEKERNLNLSSLHITVVKEDRPQVHYINTSEELAAVSQDSLSKISALHLSPALEKSTNSHIETLAEFGNVVYLAETSESSFKEFIKYAGNAEYLTFAFPLKSRLNSLHFGPDVWEVRLLYPEDYDNILTDNPHTKILVPYYLYNLSLIDSKFNSVHLERMGFIDTFYTRLCFFVSNTSVDFLGMKISIGWLLLLALILELGYFLVFIKKTRRETVSFSIIGYFLILYILGLLIMLGLIWYCSWEETDTWIFVWIYMTGIILFLFLGGRGLVRRIVNKGKTRKKYTFFFISRAGKKEAVRVKDMLVSSGFGFKEKDFNLNRSLVRFNNFNEEEISNTAIGRGGKIILLLTPEDLQNNKDRIIELMKLFKKLQKLVYPIIIGEDKGIVIAKSLEKYLKRKQGLLKVFPISFLDVRTLKIEYNKKPLKLEKLLRKLLTPKMKIFWITCLSFYVIWLMIMMLTL